MEEGNKNWLSRKVLYIIFIRLLLVLNGPNLAVAERPGLWGQGLYHSTPLLKTLRVCAVFPSSLVSAWSPRDRTMNPGRLAQTCFWHFVGQRALEHLLGWEREGSANWTLVAAQAAKKGGGHLAALSWQTDSVCDPIDGSRVGHD